MRPSANPRELTCRQFAAPSCSIQPWFKRYRVYLDRDPAIRCECEHQRVDGRLDQTACTRMTCVPKSHREHPITTLTARRPQIRCWRSSSVIRAPSQRRSGGSSRSLPRAFGCCDRSAAARIAIDESPFVARQWRADEAHHRRRWHSSYRANRADHGPTACGFAFAHRCVRGWHRMPVRLQRGT